MSLEVGRYRLLTAHKMLKARWEETRQLWRDTVREDFAKTQVDSLDPLIRATLGAIDKLTLLLGQIRQDCAEDF